MGVINFHIRPLTPPSLAKGQLISKANCQAVDSQKKNEQTNLLFLT